MPCQLVDHRAQLGLDLDPGALLHLGQGVDQVGERAAVEGVEDGDRPGVEQHRRGPRGPEEVLTGARDPGHPGSGGGTVGQIGSQVICQSAVLPPLSGKSAVPMKMTPPVSAIPLIGSSNHPVSKVPPALDTVILHR